MPASMRGVGPVRSGPTSVREVEMRCLSVSLVAMLGLSLASACGVAERPTPLRRLLLEAITSEAREAGVEIDSTQVQWTIEPSAVVQGVIFGRAHYAPPYSAHVDFIAAAVERQGHSTLITEQEVVATALRVDMPTDSARVMTLCSELVRWENGAKYARGVPEVYSTDTTWRAMGFRDPGPPWRSVAMPPSVKSTGMGAGAPGWVVSVWLIVPGSLRKFECLFDPDGTVRAAANDSIPNAGSAPENP